MSFISSPFPSCFRPSKTTDANHPPPPPPPSSAANPNLTTYIYHTDAGTVSLTWSRSILGRSLHVHLHDHPHSPLSFQLHIKPFIFWKKKKHGTKKLSHNTRIFWNLSKARFGSEPEPRSGFYVALVVDDALTLLVGDDVVSSSKCKTTREPKKRRQVLMLKREHVDVVVSQHKVYSTRTRFGGKVREIEIDCDHNNNTRLLFSVDGERVLVVERLKWKFRGNEKVEVDGVPILISWDLHDWVFENNNNNNKSEHGHAVFMFKFEENEVEDEDEEEQLVVRGKEEKRSLVNLWTRQNWSNLGSYEIGKTGKSWSSSSVSVSSSAVSSFGGSSSVMEWSSVEENELVVPVGFSLLVYAWKR